MDIFDALCLLVAAGLITAGFIPQKIADLVIYKKAIAYLLTALILYYPVSALFTIGVYLSFVARPVGFVFGLLSFRLLCLALISPRIENK